MAHFLPVLDERLAQQLLHARDLLEKMGDDLCTDFAVVSRHGVALQTVDIVSQMLGHIANVVNSDDRVAAVENIGMSDLKAKLAA